MSALNVRTVLDMTKEALPHVEKSVVFVVGTYSVLFAAAEIGHIFSREDGRPHARQSASGRVGISWNAHRGRSTGLNALPSPGE